MIRLVWQGGSLEEAFHRLVFRRIASGIRRTGWLRVSRGVNLEEMFD